MSEAISFIPLRNTSMSPLSLAGYLAERKEGRGKRREREKEMGYTVEPLTQDSPR